VATGSQPSANSEAKTVIVFAGPNGSGKSTINTRVLADPELGSDGVYIHADDIAKTLKGDFASPRDRHIAAAIQAEALRLNVWKTASPSPLKPS
jgi:predicted ABC-type ATPase